MSEPTQIADRYGLPLSTRSRAAMDHYVTGVDRLLAAEAGAARRPQPHSCGTVHPRLSQVCDRPFAGLGRVCKLGSAP
jgi:hypothetical protein